VSLCHVENVPCYIKLKGFSQFSLSWRCFQWLDLIP
jgi:hypothetical protein